MAIDLRMKGFSYSEIVKELSVPKATLSHWLRKVKMTKTQLKNFQERRLKTARVNSRRRISEISKKIESDLRPHMRVFYDDSGAVGRRYRRQDEAGTPFCITVDGQTKEDGTVTVRDRDSMEQVRVSTGQLLNHLREKLNI